VKIYRQEMGRFIIEHAKGQDGITVAELAVALEFMPNGWYVRGINNHSDGMTSVTLQSKMRTQLELTKRAKAL
jgi:hypothetical protein